MKQLVSKNWDAILEMLKNDFEIKPVLLKTFIEPLKVYDEDDENVTILLDDDVYQHYDSYIKEKFYTFIRTQLRLLRGNHTILISYLRKTLNPMILKKVRIISL